MWQDNLRVPLRVYINDIDGTTYTDETLDELMVVAAAYVIQEVRLSTLYVVDYSDFTLSPDPSSDMIFVNFIVLKAACMIAKWTFDSRAVSDGIMAICGPVHVRSDSPGSNVLMALLNDGPCRLYDELKKQNNMAGNANGTGPMDIKAILSPFTNEDSSIYPHIISRR